MTGSEQNKKCAQDGMTENKSSRSHLTSFTRILMSHAKHGRRKEFQDYVQSAAFIQALQGMDLKSRHTAIATFHKAWALCESASRTPLRAPATTRGQQGGKGRWNNPVMLEKLRRAYEKAPTDEGAARILGVSEGAARLAKKRYLSQQSVVFRLAA